MTRVPEGDNMINNYSNDNNLKVKEFKNANASHDPRLKDSEMKGVYTGSRDDDEIIAMQVGF